MIPIPAELLELYPQKPGTLRGRPWWTDTPRGFVRNTPTNRIPDQPRQLPGDCIEFDQRFPLPHPGFRVGQVWGYWQVNAPVVASIALQFGDQFLVFGADYPGSKYQHTMDSGRLHGFLAGWFLLADPCAPWLAPWAPAGEVP